MAEFRPLWLCACMFGLAELVRASWPFTRVRSVFFHRSGTLANRFLSSTVRDSHEFHWPDHVSGHVEISHMVSAVAIKVEKELTFAEIADKTIQKAGFEFFIFSHPLLPDELAVLDDKDPRSTKLIIGVRADII